MTYEEKLVEYERRRLRAARLLKDGVTHAEVARRTNVSRQSVLRWSRTLQENGANALSRADHFGRPPCLTPSQREQLQHCLEEGASAAGYSTDQWTLARVEAVVEDKFGVNISTASASRLLHDMGLNPTYGARAKRR